MEVSAVLKYHFGLTLSILFVISEMCSEIWDILYSSFSIPDISVVEYLSSNR